jgi:hypothetical protein
MDHEAETLDTLDARATDRARLGETFERRDLGLEPTARGVVPRR